MSSKTKNTINWVLAGLVAFIFLGSAFFKLTGAPEAVEGAKKFGLSAATFTSIGVVELVSIVLFLIPRTGVLGTLLLAAYMGGAIATHLEHGESIVAPVCIAAFVWVVAVVRFPELLSRITGKMTR